MFWTAVMTPWLVGVVMYASITGWISYAEAQGTETTDWGFASLMILPLIPASPLLLVVAAITSLASRGAVRLVLFLGALATCGYATLIGGASLDPAQDHGWVLFLGIGSAAALAGWLSVALARPFFAVQKSALSAASSPT